MSIITQKVIERIQSRAALGYKKYGNTMDRTDLSFNQWAEHAIEEALDFAQYIQAMKDKKTYVVIQDGDAIAASDDLESAVDSARKALEEKKSPVSVVPISSGGTIHPKVVVEKKA